MPRIDWQSTYNKIKRILLVSWKSQIHPSSYAYGETLTLSEHFCIENCTFWHIPQFHKWSSTPKYVFFKLLWKTTMRMNSDNEIRLDPLMDEYQMKFHPFVRIWNGWGQVSTRDLDSQWWTDRGAEIALGLHRRSGEGAAAGHTNTPG